MILIIKSIFQYLIKYHQNTNIIKSTPKPSKKVPKNAPFKQINDMMQILVLVKIEQI